jgi:hypothetical protein
MKKQTVEEVHSTILHRNAVFVKKPIAVSMKCSSVRVIFMLSNAAQVGIRVLSNRRSIQHREMPPALLIPGYVASQFSMAAWKK